MTIEEIQTRTELKELADKFSNLADEKDAEGQCALFTEDCIFAFQIGFDGEAQQFSGKAALVQAFASTLNANKALYHINGQQLLSFNGDTAAGTAYCQAILVAEENGKTVMHTNSIRYEDEYRKTDGRWLISKRRSIFLICDKKELSE